MSWFSLEPDMLLSRQVHSLHISVPIPATTTREKVISTLQDHGTMMSLQPLVSHWKELPSETNSTVKRYSFTESIPIIPFLGAWGRKDVTSEATFENTENGVKSVAHAPAGVLVRAGWRLERAVDEEVQADPKQEEQHGEDAGGWILTEDVSVECAAALMWFVKGQMEQAHRDICRKVMEKSHTGR